MGNINLFGYGVHNHAADNSLSQQTPAFNVFRPASLLFQSC